jgi:endonuclease YncB( thermonuclease family)
MVRRMTRLQSFPRLSTLAITLTLLSGPASARQHGLGSIWHPEKPLHWIITVACVGALIAFMMRRHGGLLALAVLAAAALAWTSGLIGSTPAVLLRQLMPTVVSSGSPGIVRTRQKGSEYTTATPVIIDGDSFSLAGERIRILNIDAPESFHARCEHELVLALKARQRLKQLLTAGAIKLQRDGHDRTGRTLARVRVGGRDVGDILIGEGHALPYRSGGNNKLTRLRVWCGSQANLDDRWNG